MTRAVCRLAPIVAVAAASLSLAAPPEASRLLEMKKEAARLLEGATAAGETGDRAERARLLTAAARQLQLLAAEVTFPPELRRDLEGAAADLRVQADRPPRPLALDPSRRLLERVEKLLSAPTPANLPFQGSYSQPKVAEPAYGGHASAMGPPPEMRAAPRESRRPSSSRRCPG